MSEAFSRILIDKALEDSGWNLLKQVHFELSTGMGLQGYSAGIIVDMNQKVVDSQEKNIKGDTYSIIESSVPLRKPKLRSKVLS